jgi:hypothetical protein
VPTHQNSRFWTSVTAQTVIVGGVPNGGSARGYQERSALRTFCDPDHGRARQADRPYIYASPELVVIARFCRDEVRLACGKIAAGWLAS